ncbi:Zn-dependent hydrolase [Leptolyngbya sp. 'hensonii']|uniref:MBL fold metallo-hydrolase n=1 Tax=Leptolyngbya sp. 'hensonii' TaxID=1922337 RepID=UPI00094F99DF|nr:MBL fold metallo-hydrolase [Leptolyngbya sp. 'hensonii']OLP19578.1 Zn-dependent hydrolase [Leptolyngbya sp. 'hensonii']
MKRRHLIRYAQASLLASLGMGVASGLQVYRAQTSSPKQSQKAASGGSLSIQWLGHTCFLFTGEGKRILVNPFRTVGCTARYRLPKVASDLVMISSQLLDEGFIEAVPGNPRLLYEAGLYQFKGMPIQGIGIDHDRNNGRRFGNNVAWRWTQSGIRIVHLGGAAGPIVLEQKILMGRPDVLLIPVGGGPKAYNAQEAKQTIQALNPRLVIPTHYRTQAADPAACEIAPLDEFLSLMEGTSVRRVQSDTVTLKASDLPEQGPQTMVMSYRF